MSGIRALVADNLGIWTNAVGRKSSSGRGSSKKVNLYGIERLRALIFELAIRGKLVPQDATDEPAAMLLPKMAEERERRIKAKEIKKAKLPASVDEEPFVLPIGWTWIPMSQTGNIFTGNSVNSKVRSELESNATGRPYVATKDIGYGFDPIVYENGLLAAADDKRFVVAKPSTIFICAEGGSAGRKIAISDREITFGNKLIANETWSSIAPRFVLYTYLSDFFFNQFSAQMTGIIGGISRAKFLALPFPLPPFEEQRRIVAKVDELMALCDALERGSEDALAAHQLLVKTLIATLTSSADAADLAKNWARLEAHFDTLFTTQHSIDALKQAIIELALRGRLVEQVPEDEPASELMIRIKAWQAKKVAAKQIRLPRKPLNPVEEGGEPYELPSGWAWARLGEIINIQSGDGLTAAEMIDGSIPVYGGNGINGYHNEQNIFQPTIVIGRVGFYCGSVHVTPEAAWITDNAFITRFSHGEIELKFLELLLNGTNLKENENATAQPVISGSKVYPIIVGLPPLSEQKRIVAKVEELTALCELLNCQLTDAEQTQRDLADTIVEMAVV